MKKILINPLFIMAALELEFLNQLPADAASFTSKQKTQVFSIYYKYLGTLPANVLQDIESGARQARKNKGQADTQRIILNAIASMPKEPTAVDLFLFIVSNSPVLLARLVSKCYIIVEEDGSQVPFETLLVTPSAPLVSDSPLRTEVGDAISVRWGARGQSPSTLTPELLQGITNHIQTNGVNYLDPTAVDSAIENALALHIAGNALADDKIQREVENGVPGASEAQVQVNEHDNNMRGVHDAIVKIGGRSTQASVSYVAEAIAGQTFSTEEEGVDAVRYAYTAFAASHPEYALNTEPAS